MRSRRWALPFGDRADAPYMRRLQYLPPVRSCQLRTTPHYRLLRRVYTFLSYHGQADNSRSWLVSWSQEHLATCALLLPLTGHRFPRFLCGTPQRAAIWRLFPLVFALFSIRSFHAVRSAPVSTSSLAAARRICVCPIFPQPPGIGRKISGASSTNAACCSSVSIRFPYPPACEASEANFLPPTRKAGNPAWEYSSTPSRLSAIVRKSAAFIG